MAGMLYLVPTPIGNLGDISQRCRETLENADFIAAEDTRVTLKLLNHLGIKKIETMAFGDSFNDESMISLVEYGVAMKNAQDEIKEKARFVTEYTNNQDGAAVFLENWVL